MIKFAITMFDDIQRHQVGCLCGRCEVLTGRSFGVSIRECREYSANIVRDEGSVEKAIMDDDVIERVYSSNPLDAREAAKKRAEELGYKFLGDI